MRSLLRHSLSKELKILMTLNPSHRIAQGNLNCPQIMILLCAGIMWKTSAQLIPDNFIKIMSSAILKKCFLDLADHGNNSNRANFKKQFHQMRQYHPKMKLHETLELMTQLKTENSVLKKEITQKDEFIGLLLPKDVDPNFSVQLDRRQILPKNPDKLLKDPEEDPEEEREEIEEEIEIIEELEEHQQKNKMIDQMCEDVKANLVND